MRAAKSLISRRLTRPRLTLIQAGLVCVVMLGIGTRRNLIGAEEGPSQPALRKPSASLPCPRLGADGAGNGLAVIPSEDGAQLRCVLQQLEASTTREGLWLISTVTNAVNHGFRIVAAALGRQTGEQLALPLPLPETGSVAVDGRSVRFTRPGLVEEYTVSVDGVRQDFIITKRPIGEGPLRLELAVSGAKVELAAGAARLVLNGSQRKIAYGRLRVTDGTGKERTARMEVAADGEYQRDFIAQPTVAGLTSYSGLINPIALGWFRSTTEWQTRTQHEHMAPTLAVVVDDSDATYPLRIDPTFSDANWTSMNPSIPGASSTVEAAVVDNSGNLYIGGSFTAVGDVGANFIAKWNGTNWLPLGLGLDNTVLALAVSGSNLYAGGAFTTAGGSAANYIAKWDGTNWSALGSGMNYTVSALAASANDVYAGGQFTMAGGTAVNRVAKWNGSVWSPLGSGLDNPTGHPVLALAVSGNDLYAGGSFTTAGGSAATNIAKWDGSNWLPLGSGMIGGVMALAVSGSDLYAGGGFRSAGGTAVKYVAKWDGINWSALGSGIGGSSPIVYALAASGSNLYAGGAFTIAGDGAATNIAKWDGSSWSALGSGMGGVTHPYVYALQILGSNVFAGGIFMTAGGSAANRIAKWDGSSWSGLDSSTVGYGLSTPVPALAASGNDLYAAGGLTAAGNKVPDYVAKWDGSKWAALGSEMNNDLYALAVSGSNLYAGGAFTTAGGSAANYIAKWDGSTWSALGSGMNGGVFALAVSGSNLYAGGQFSTAGGSGVNYIAQWNGSSWSPLGSGVGGPFPTVYGLVASGSDLYAGGQFTTAGGSAANRIAKWNGTNWAPLGSGVGGGSPYVPGVSALAVSGSEVYAGGLFTTAGGSAANYIAKWDGSSWSPVGSGVGGLVNALTMSGNDVYVGGTFTTADGGPANYIAKWDGSSWWALGSGVNGPVSALAVSGKDLYTGGVFTTAGGKVSAYIARGYLLDLPALSVLRSGTDVIVSWPSANTASFALEQAGTLAAPGGWITKTASVADDGSNKSVRIPATNSPQFFRLRRP